MPMCIWGGLDGLQDRSTQITNYQKHLHIQMECGLTGGLWQIAWLESLSKPRHRCLGAYLDAGPVGSKPSNSTKPRLYLSVDCWFRHPGVIASTPSNSTLPHVFVNRFETCHFLRHEHFQSTYIASLPTAYCPPIVPLNRR